MSEVSWRHNGRQPLFNVTILPPAPTTDLRGASDVALLDTGSTSSGITRRLAESLGLVGRGKRPIASAHSESQVEHYWFRVALQPDSVDSAPTFPFVFEEVVGFELRNAFQFQILIGMDILRQCDLTMTRDHRCLLQFGRS